MYRRNTLRVAAVLGVCLLVSTVAAAQWRWTPQTGRWVNVSRMPKETPELQLEHARSFLMQGEYDEASVQADRFTRFYGESDLADENQFLKGEILLAQNEYMRSARQFQSVVGSYPDSDLYDDVIGKQYEIGDILYNKGLENMEKGRRPWRLFRKRPLRRAIEVYSMVIDNQPFTTEAAEAQYKVGLSHFTREEYVEAAFEYRTVIEEYSGSEWVDEARYDLALCYYNSSLPAAYDQAPSLLTITAISRFQERYPNDPRTDELEEKRVEMRERVAQQRLRTAEFYEEREMGDSARIYYEVLVNQFGDTEAADAARQWLEAHPLEAPQPVEHTIGELRDRIGAAGM